MAVCQGSGMNWIVWSIIAMWASAAWANPAATIEIAPSNAALTFARSGERTIAVRSYAAGRVRGVDLSSVMQAGEDAIDLLVRLGYDAVRQASLRGEEVTLEAATLDVPVRLGEAHIAVGTNYREHAEEATVEGGPFLFPKMVAPTSAHASITAGQALLDYEVELCLVAVRPIGPSESAGGGLILCNDVTDRATLLRQLDPAHPKSGKGFTSGKSAPGYLPVGDLFVVPRDLAGFVASLELRLAVNGTERQQAPVTQWVWDFDEILRRARDQRDVTWEYWGGTARLPLGAYGTLEPRTMILAGTPAGTVFQGIHTSDYAWGIADWLLGGWSEPVARHVIERHITAAQASKSYLQPGDVVTIEVDRLGRIVNTIEP